MPLELKSYPVAGYDGPRGSLFMTIGGGEATADDGWALTFAMSVGGALIAYVRDPDGTHIATYAVDVEEFCAEAFRLACEKKSDHELAATVALPPIDRIEED